MFETIPVEGTWTVDFTDEVGYHKYEYYTFSLVFSMNDAQDKLVWKMGYSGVRHTLSKESSDASFITPSRTYEQWDDIEITDVTTTNTGFDCEKDEEHFDLYSSWYRLFYR